MFVNKSRNVCQALPKTIHYLLEFGQREDSRAGEVLVAPHPILTETTNPRERVLFSAKRDANPFFHIAEALWMLAGRNDATFLDKYISNFSKLYAEPGGILHDAYGWRWRKSFGDQLDLVVHNLIAEPESRQQVIQMWDATYINDDLAGKWRSKPCNTNIFLRLNGAKLDITVCCRSNDMLWGAHGANAVHFSILQEYIAARIDAEVGTMYQLSNNAHIYIDLLDKMAFDDHNEFNDDRYFHSLVPMAMFTDPEEIDNDLNTFMQAVDEDSLGIDDYCNPWFHDTASNMLLAHRHFKRKNMSEAMGFAGEIAAPDWRVAVQEWLERRM